MSLSEYRRKRHFRRTPEPAGKIANKSGWSFVIQKHAATRLHYDLRLEMGGVLKSWTVPKGPCLDPTVKRLAVQVEDHPIEYGDFEGIIPAGEYGGGTVLLWDQGWWEPIGDAQSGWRAGKLKFELHGSKLQGRWMLVRSHGRGQKTSTDWLLMKERDDAAQPLSAGDILEEQPLSVISKRDLESISQGEHRVWRTDSAAENRRKNTRSRTASKSRRPSSESDSSKRPNEKLPAFVAPQLATLTRSAPSDGPWLHEVKYDGYRILCRIQDGNATFLSRNQLDWTNRLGSLVQVAAALPVQSALLDGEVVKLRPDGTSDFQALQNAFRDGVAGPLVYYVFDLLHLDGQNWRETPLVARKARLASLLETKPAGAIRYSEHIDGQGPEFAQRACQMRLEGIISKRGDRPYRPGHGYDWLKIKCIQEDEFVVGGYTDPSGSRHGLGALLLGYYDPPGELQYVGKVGTGFDDRTLRDLTRRLQRLARDKAPFANAKQLTDVRNAHWVEPSLVAQVAYGNRTEDGRLRHAAFLGLREDKPAAEVTLEAPVPVQAAMKKSGPRRSRSKPARSQPASGAKQTKQNQTRKKGRPVRATYDAANETFAGVRLTSGTKVLYEAAGLTKLDLAAFYQEIAAWILPHLEHRPVVLVRCPDGQSGECFYQKHPGVGTPEALRQITIREKTKPEPYVVIDDVQGLIALAQIGTLEIHAWGSREDRLEKPDRLIFDLDPDVNVRWSTVVDSARQLRDFLSELGLRSFVKTTGGKGLHLVVPIERRHSWDDAKAFSKQVAEAIVTAAPHQYTANMSKAARTQKIFIDYLRNCRGATAVAPYSPRARPAASISTPLTWSELSTKVPSDHFTLRNIRRRLASLNADPWEGFAATRQGLTQPWRRLKATFSDV